MGEPLADDKGEAGAVVGGDGPLFASVPRIVDKRRLNCYKGKIFCFTGSPQP